MKTTFSDNSHILRVGSGYLVFQWSELDLDAERDSTRWDGFEALMDCEKDEEREISRDPLV